MRQIEIVECDNTDTQFVKITGQPRHQVAKCTLSGSLTTLPPSQIETTGMARRCIHNEGARILQERLEGKAAVDTDTARRLFTLICVLHFGG